MRALARRLYRSLAPHDRSLAWAEALDPDRRALVLDHSGRAVRLPGRDAWIDLGERRGSLRLLAALQTDGRLTNQELADTKVVVTSVHPGGIKTNIVRNAKVHATPGGNNKGHITSRFDSVARTSAEDAAKAILGAIQKKKKKLLIGLDAHAMDLAKRLMPEEFTSLVGFFTQKFG